MQNLFYIEITDTFGGEANYSWVTRHVIRAKSVRGAMAALARRSGLNWRKVSDYGDSVRYNSKAGATCAFVEYFDIEYHGTQKLDSDDRIK